MAKYLEEIDTYLESADIPLLVYGAYLEEINNRISFGNRVVLITFSSAFKLLTWLKTGLVEGSHKLRFITVNAALDVIPKSNHRNNLLLCGATKDSVAIVISCNLSKRNTAYCSVSVFGGTNDETVFDEINNKLPVHRKSLLN